MAGFLLANHSFTIATACWTMPRAIARLSDSARRNVPRRPPYQGHQICGWHAKRKDVSRKDTKLMHIIWILLIGLIVGALAKLVMPGRDPGGFIITILLGIAGSFLANYIGRAAGWYAPNESAGFIASIIGAVILLAGYRLIIGRRGPVLR